MSKSWRKILITGASLLMIASVGTGASNVSINARSRHYHYRSHKVYKRIKSSHKINWKSYLYNIQHNDEFKELSLEFYVNNNHKQALLRRFSYNGRTIPCFDSFGRGFIPLKLALKEIKHKHISFAKYIKRNNISKGTLFEMKDWGGNNEDPLFYTPSQMSSMAKVNHMSLKKYKKEFSLRTYKDSVTKENRSGFTQFINWAHHKGHKISKYWYSTGYPTPLMLRTVDKDAINNINKERESQGISPLTQNPYLQMIANNYTKRKFFLSGVNYKGLTARQKKIYRRIDRETNNDSGGTASDMYFGVYMPKDSPKTIANTENSTMQKYNNYRLNPSYTEIGLSIGPIGGGFAEFYGKNEPNSANYYNQNRFNRNVSVKQQTLDDLKQDRASVNESPLNEDPTLDNIAQQRSQQLVNNFSHYDNNGNPYVYDDGLSSNNWAENIAYVSGGHGAQAANNMNYNLFNAEKPYNGGHYENIISNSNVGVGVTKHNGSTYLVEDFT